MDTITSGNISGVCFLDVSKLLIKIVEAVKQ